MKNWTPFIALALAISLTGCGAGADSSGSEDAAAASPSPLTSGGELEVMASEDFSIVSPEACTIDEVEPDIYVVRASPFSWSVALGEAAEVSCEADRVRVDVEPGFRLIFATMDPARSEQTVETLGRRLVDAGVEAILGIAPADMAPLLSLGSRARAGVCRSFDHLIDETAVRTGICAAWTEGDDGFSYLGLATITDTPASWQSAPQGLEELAGSLFDNWTIEAPQG